MSTPTILVFDSGLGGLTVFREVRKLRLDANYVYVADDAFFPYSDHDEAALSARVLDVMSDLIDEHQPDLVVIACNTASTIVLPALRARFDAPFVGTVPAIKPACARSKSRLVSVLGTAATVRREYTQALIRDFGEGCDVNLVGSDRLARLAEITLAGDSIADEVLLGEIAPCFIEAGPRRTDVIVLACTHYPLLLDSLQRISPWQVDWLDPAEAIARRVVDLIGPPDNAKPGAAQIFFTSGRKPSSAMAESLRRFGIDTGHI